MHAEIGQISDQVAPGPGEPVIVKHYPNSFVGTDLDARLRQAPGRELILAGLMTHVCVNSTAHARNQQRVMHDHRKVTSIASLPRSMSPAPESRRYASAIKVTSDAATIVASICP